MTPLAETIGFEGGLVRLRNPIGGQCWTAGPFDSIVVASPGRPCDGIAHALSAGGPEVRVVGDAYAPRDVESAVLEGFEVGDDV